MTYTQLECEKVWLDCQECDLFETRNRVVIGHGYKKASLYFTGTGPGDTEDRLGEPFVGRAGELFDDFLRSLSLSRDEIFINNVVGCRPFVEDDEGNRKDRDPLVPEINACIGRLYESIYTVDPILIVAMGNVAFKALTKDNTKITKARGGIYEAMIPGREGPVEYPVLATYHPSYLVRNSKEKNKPGSIWEEMFDDLREAVKMTDIARHNYYSIGIPTR